MNAGYESGGYGMIDLDGTLTERSRMAGTTAQEIQANADLLLQSHPHSAEAAIVFSPLVPLLGGFDEENSRNAMHRSVAGYHRMFFEHNLPLDVPSSRELAPDNLQNYKLILLPYPLMMTHDEAKALENYVSKGGHLFVEARPGWVDEQGHAETVVPGFGWHEMLGVRETSIEPAKEIAVKWGPEEFDGTGFQERFGVLNPSARVVAAFADGTPAAYQCAYGNGDAILLGTFAGQRNDSNPQTDHPLAGILARWAGLSTPPVKAPKLVEFRQLDAARGQFIFLFNHGKQPARVEFNAKLPQEARGIREIVTAQVLTADGRRFHVETEIPSESVRVYRIDFK
ncbi:MAG TPA: beta-galactosidase trimerization domain-containing protein [Candidatus Dormibacteraeota bacterium]|nr:beta-galactosidase trimerization domain-containing protein [Candidatus Dormibacteraeota bacterium]